jgi:hypothetical protein
MGVAYRSYVGTVLTYTAPLASCSNDGPRLSAPPYMSTTYSKGSGNRPLPKGDFPPFKEQNL